MDVVTQGLLGAAASQAVAPRRLGRWRLAIGAFAGVLPDADVLIQSAADPLMYLTMHRGFSHSLAFIPVGALLATLPFLAIARLRASFKSLYIAALAGYATHGPLDALTSYGTVLLWPLSDWRVEGDVISVVDLAFTLALVMGIALGVKRDQSRPPRLALAFCAVYLALGGVQRHRALSAQQAIAAARGDLIDHGRVVPAPLTLLIWRSVYRTPEGAVQADAVRVGMLGTTYRAGARTASFDAERSQAIAGAAAPARMRRDLATFHWFADGYWARAPGRRELIGDMRISSDPASMQPLWGIELSPESDLPVRRATGPRELDFGGFVRELVGIDDRHRPVP